MPTRPTLFTAAATWSLSTAICFAWVALGDRAIAGDPTASGKGPIEVEEIVDPAGKSVIDVFRFEPPLVRAPVGATVRFVHTAGTHQPVMIEAMLPDGVIARRLPYMRTAEVVFERPGIYGFRCSVHGRHGMVMLVAVGEEWPNLATAKAAMPGGAAGERFTELFGRLLAKSH